MTLKYRDINVLKYWQLKNLRVKVENNSTHVHLFLAF